MKLRVAEFEALTYREMWDTYVEPNLPAEETEEGRAAAGQAAAVAAALTLGASPDVIAKLLK